MKSKIKSIIAKISKRKLVKNFLLIFTGQGIASIFTLVATVLIIAGIGSEQHGILIVVQTYATFFFSLFSFKTFHALIKYLVKARQNKNETDVKMYIKWSLVLDVGSLIFMFIMGILLRDPVIKLMGWPNEMRQYVILYLLIQLVNINGTTTGVLRSYEKYNYVVRGQIISTLIRCVGYTICFAIRRDFVSFFIAEIIATLSNYLLLIYYTYKVLKAENLLDFYKVKLKNKKEFLKFNLYNNLTVTLDLPVNQVTQLIINKYLGFAANSAYSVFEKLGAIINKLGDPINQIIYPEMNLHIAENNIDAAKKLSRKLKKLMIVVFAGSACLTLLTYRLWFHILIPDGNGYLWAFVLYLAFVSYVNGAMGTHNLFLALGYVKYNIPILVVVNSLYLVFLFIAVQKIGLIGVILVYLIQAMSMVLIKELILKKNQYKEYVSKPRRRKSNA